jgi:hypothetical protein
MPEDHLEGVPAVTNILLVRERDGVDAALKVAEAMIFACVRIIGHAGPLAI